MGLGLSQMRLGLGSGGVTPLQRALSSFPGAQNYARYDDEYGAAGLYYAAGSIRTSSEVTADIPSGEPTYAGMLVDGSDAPYAVQGLGAEKIENGDFSDGLTGYTVILGGQTVEETGGRLHIVTDGTGCGVRQSVAVSGITYHVELDYEAVSGSLKMDVGSTHILDTTQHYSFNITASQASAYLYRNAGAAEGYIDNFSMKPVLPFLGATEGATEYTASQTWNANGVTGDRVCCTPGWADANNYLVLHFVSGLLRFESFVAGVSEGFVAVAGIDDGGTHTAVMYWDEVAGTLSLDVDGQGLEGPELVANGGFDSPANWSLTGTAPDIEITGGKLSFNITGSNHQAAQNISIDEGVTYRMRGDAVKTSGANLKVRLGGADGDDQILSTGAVDEIMVAGSSDELRVRSNGTVVATWDSFSVVRASTRTGLTLPTNIIEFRPGHNGGNQLNGLVIERVLATGDHMVAWS